MPETTEDEKIYGHEVVPSQPTCEAPINDDPPIDDDSKNEPLFSPYYE